MAGSVNKVILVGNLGRDPEVKSMQDGRSMVNMSVATSETWRDRQSGERKERTEWHRVVIFNEKLARGRAEVPEEGLQGLSRGPALDPQMDRPERPGALHDRGRDPALRRRSSPCSTAAAAAVPARVLAWRRRTTRWPAAMAARGGGGGRPAGAPPRPSSTTTFRSRLSPALLVAAAASERNGLRRGRSACSARARPEGKAIMAHSAHCSRGGASLRPRSSAQWYAMLAGNGRRAGFAKMGETILAQTPGNKPLDDRLLDIGAGRIAHMDERRHRHAGPVAYLAGRAGVRRAAGDAAGGPLQRYRSRPP